MNTNTELKSIVGDLINWFSENKRDFAIRNMSRLSREQRIYRVWIFEVMSQQSTLKTVLPRYEEWMKLMPSLEALRAASLTDVLRIWTGLGYYSRARNLFFSAKNIQSFSQFQTWEDFLKIKGVGEYTAKAIASVALDSPVIPVDGNVTRVASRYWGIQDPLNNQVDRMKIVRELEKLTPFIPHGRRSHFAQAWIELGSQVCKATSNPVCNGCPLFETCSVPQLNLDWRSFPVPRARTRIQKQSLLILLYTNKGQRKEVLVRRIPEDWPLGGQWEIPWVGRDGWMGLRGKSKPAPLEKINNYSNIPETKLGIGRFKHSIMQYQFLCELMDLGSWKGPIPEGHRWIDIENTDALITTQSRKALEMFSTHLKTQEKSQFLLDKPV
jgi:A/G-specific adenine glycosylase